MGGECATLSSPAGTVRLRRDYGEEMTKCAKAQGKAQGAIIPFNCTKLTLLMEWGRCRPGVGVVQNQGYSCLCDTISHVFTSHLLWIERLPWADSSSL